MLDILSNIQNFKELSKVVESLLNGFYKEMQGIRMSLDDLVALKKQELELLKKRGKK